MKTFFFKKSFKRWRESILKPPITPRLACHSWTPMPVGKARSWCFPESQKSWVVSYFWGQQVLQGGGKGRECSLSPCQSKYMRFCIQYTPKGIELDVKVSWKLIWVARQALHSCSMAKKKNTLLCCVSLFSPIIPNLQLLFSFMYTVFLVIISNIFPQPFFYPMHAFYLHFLTSDTAKCGSFWWIVPFQWKRNPWQTSLVYEATTKEIEIFFFCNTF